MDTIFQSALAVQFGSSIDMLENALRACPERLWRVRLWDDQQLPDFAEFWYLGYHTLFWLDLYLSGSLEGFLPPAPFTLAELDPAGVLPPRPYTQAELLIYLEHCRLKCRATIDGLTEEKSSHICKFLWGELTFAALLLDNMRHVQEHTAQLNMLLGQQLHWSPKWVANAHKPAA